MTDSPVPVNLAYFRRTAKYVGCLGINTSMKSLDFDTRSQIVKECINRVCECAGLKTVDKKGRTEKRINRMLAENPNMDCAGVDVNLVITSAYLHLTAIETEENIVRHEMPNISFASRGDVDTLDFVAYVAKDHRYGRACFVVECGEGQAQDVISAIGQAFEVRFKEYLKRSPRSSSANERLESICALSGVSAVRVSNNVSTNIVNRNFEDRDYYNDLPGKIPPDSSDISSRESATIERLPTAVPRSPLKKTTLASSEQNDPNLIDLNIDIQDETKSCDLQIHSTNQSNIVENIEPQYVNCPTVPTHPTQHSSLNQRNDSNSESSEQLKDPFDMEPFNSALAAVTPKAADSSVTSLQMKSCIDFELEKEEWFHGSICRKESEELVVKDGDFLVRESQGSLGQYVLTGMQSGVGKHLLLVDPEGVVRTKDKTFGSVSHLINYHRNNGLPIISAESVLILRNPIIVRH